MPSQVNVDSYQVGVFIQQINENVAQLEQQIPKTEQAFDTVAQSWKDEQFTKFKNRFDEDMQMIKPLCTALHNYEDLLANYKSKLDRYVTF